jgi:hypothetical protein
MLIHFYISPTILNSVPGTPLITEFNSRKIKYYLILFLVYEVCVGSTNTVKTHVI